jgi:hypothetical protein
MAKALFATLRSPSGATKSEGAAIFWCNVAIFVAIVQLPYYEILPWGLPTVMIAAAAAWRERLVARPARRLETPSDVERYARAGARR